MIKSIIENWEKDKSKLEDWFREGNGHDYEEIVTKIVELFLQELQIDKWDIRSYSKVNVIDEGNYQGELLFVIIPDDYQPSVSEFIITDQYYGSCSGCDLLQGIWGYSDDKPTDEQVRELMLLSLHLIQKMKFIGDLDNEN